MIKLSLDEDFVACPVVDGDELFPNGVFEFNVSRILAYLERCPDDVVLVSVAVGDFPRWLDDLDEAHVAAADLARPLVLAEIAPGRFNVIDGHHRLEKARRHGVGTLQAYRLRVAQHLSFLTSAKAYRTFVAYWNGKVDERDAANVIEWVVASDRPAVITQRGRATAVLVSVEAHDRVQYENELLRALARGDAEIATGHGRDAERVMAEARARLDRE